MILNLEFAVRQLTIRCIDAQDLYCGLIYLPRNYLTRYQSQSLRTYTELVQKYKVMSQSNCEGIKKLFILISP